MMNLPQLISMLSSARDPQQMMMSYLEQNAQSNPGMQQILAYMKNGQSGSIEDYVRNYVNSQGGDFDRDFGAFKKMLGAK